MPTCTICQQDKQDDQFNLRKKSTGERYKHCKDCQKKLRQAAYQKNRSYYLDYDKKHAPIRRKERRNFIVSLKEGKPCADCGNTFPHYVMDFDHLPEYTKSFQISRHGHYHSLEVIQTELAKCEIVCANCHRERTWKRKHGG